MALLKSDSAEVELADGSQIIDAAEELGVCFGCQAGNCGSCLTNVVAGMENLSNYSDNEEAFGVEDKERLLCQCTINGGEVTIDI